MPLLVGVIMTALSGVVGMVLMRIIAGLGIAFIAYNGLSDALNSATHVFDGFVSGAPADVVAVLKIMGIYTALKIYIAAWGGAIAAKSAFRVLRFIK